MSGYAGRRGTGPTSGDGDLIALDRIRDGLEVCYLRAFVAVAEELNFSRAAERPYLSQPALSRQIRALERLVGCDLLHRSTRHVALTLAGEALLDRARPVLAALDEAVAAARSVGGEMAARIMRMWAPVVVVASAVASTQQLRDVFEAFLAQLPVPDLAVRAVNAGPGWCSPCGSGCATRASRCRPASCCCARVSA